MVRHDFAIPNGWTYQQYRSFLQTCLSENKPKLPVDESSESADSLYGYYPYLTDFDDKMLIFDDGDYDGDLFQVGFTITKGAAGRTLTWDGDAIEVAEKTTYVPIAQFAAPARFTAFALGENSTDDGEYVIKRGTVFEAGDYPDYPVTFTSDDLKNAIAHFKPVPNRINHASGEDRTPSYFDGKCGELAELTLSDNGETLIGAVKLPKAFNDFYLATYPDDPLKISLEFTDKLVTGSALVPNPRIESVALMSAYTAFAKDYVPVVVREVVTKEPGMTTPTTPEVEAVKAAVVPPEEAPVSRAEFARVQSELDAERKKGREKDADRFAREVIRTGRQTAAMFASLKQQYLTAAEDDAASPRTFTFAKGAQEAQGTRTQMLEAHYATMTPGLQLVESLPPDSGIIMPFADEPAVAAAGIKQAKDSATEYATRMNKTGRA